MLKRLLLTMVFAFAVQNTANAQSDLSLIPLPTYTKLSSGNFSINANTPVIYNNPEAKETAHLIANQLKTATGFALPIQQQKKDNKAAIFLNLVQDKDLAQEGYRLTVDHQIRIEAQTTTGLFYGAQTLRQLLPPEIFSNKKQNVNWVVPKIRIEDAPRLKWRGMHLDVSRHMFAKEDIKRFIDAIASFKFNTLHWHLTDDQGWRIEIKKYPKLTEIGGFREETLVGHLREKPRKFDGKPYGGFYTQKEIKEIVAYATERHINVVPEIDMPGHMQAAIAAYPEFGTRPEHKTKVRTFWGVSANILNMDDKTVQFTKDVLTEVMALFPSKYIHIGGDEAAKGWWKKSERIQWHIKDKGLKDEHDLQSWFIKDITQFLGENGRRLIGWDEITEEGELADDAIVMWWRQRSHKSINEAAANGHQIVVANNSSLYFDHRQDKDINEPLNIGGWADLKKVYNYDPYFLIDKDNQDMILGVQGQLWTEYIPNYRKLEYMAFPRAWALSEVAWSTPKNRNYEDFKQRLFTQEIRALYLNMNFRKTKID